METTPMIRQRTPRPAGHPRMPAPPLQEIRPPVLVEKIPAGPIPVAVLACDPITGEGAAAYLATRPGVQVLPVDRQHEAEVVLILVSRVTEQAL